MIKLFMSVPALDAAVSLVQKPIRVPFYFNDTAVRNADKYTAAPVIHAGTMGLNPFDLF
jgi:hypothetical protein